MFNRYFYYTFQINTTIMNEKELENKILETTSVNNLQKYSNTFIELFKSSILLDEPIININMVLQKKLFCSFISL